MIEDIDKKTKLVIFDFDKTLVCSPEPEFGKSIWKEKTGEEWIGGWFSESNSLNVDIFHIPLILTVHREWKKYHLDCQALCVMLTGRIKSLSQSVERVLSHHNLKFDDHLYNEGRETSESKMNHIEMILKYNPSLRELVMFDDRLLHLPLFKKWGDELVEKGYLDKFQLIQVKDEKLIKH